MLAERAGHAVAFFIDDRLARQALKSVSIYERGDDPAWIDDAFDVWIDPRRPPPKIVRHQSRRPGPMSIRAEQLPADRNPSMTLKAGEDFPQVRSSSGEKKFVVVEKSDPAYPPRC